MPFHYDHMGTPGDLVLAGKRALRPLLTGALPSNYLSRDRATIGIRTRDLLLTMQPLYLWSYCDMCPVLTDSPRVQMRLPAVNYSASAS